jgi:hypothetical protein
MGNDKDGYTHYATVTAVKMCVNDPNHVCRCGEVAPPEEGGGHYDCPGPPGATGATGPSTVGYDTAREIDAYVERRAVPFPEEWQASYASSSVLAEAMLADAVRKDPPRLPTDSSVRKRTPLCTGLIDYFPASLKALVAFITGEAPCANSMVEALRDRDWGSVCLIALCDLASEVGCESELYNVLDLDSLFTEFAAPLAEVAQVSWHGNDKHNPGQPLHHTRGKSMDHPDCIARHHVEAGGFDGPMRHSACKLWRGLAAWQLQLEAEGAPKARGAK